VRELCARVCERESSDPPTEESEGFMHGCLDCEKAIRQLDLTKDLAPSSTEEKEKNDG